MLVRLNITMSEMICKTVAVAFSRYYTNNSLNKILYKFNGTFYVLRKIVQNVPD